jgi:hypothetical protein
MERILLMIKYKKMTEIETKIKNIEIMLDGLHNGGDVTEAARSSIQYAINEAKNVINKSESISGVTDWLFIDDIAAMYGKVIKYKWLTPDGQNWEQKEGMVNANLLREMEQGSIKEACL